MYNPSGVEDSEGEWFEVYNATGRSVDLLGLAFRDNNNKIVDHTVATELVVEAGSYTVFGRSGDLKVNGGVSVDVSYDKPKNTDDEMGLNNNDDTIYLQYGDVVFDMVPYNEDKGWPSGSGASLNLNVDYLDGADNDEPQFWCVAQAVYGSGKDEDGEVYSNAGTPGTANEACLDPIDNDGDGFSENEGDCNDKDETIYPGADEIQSDDIDQDCDGEDLTATPLSELLYGDLVITEVMQNPDSVSDGDGEYFEVYNNTSAAVDISGLYVYDVDSDGAVSTDFTVGISLNVESGEYVVIGKSTDIKTNGGVDVAFAFGGSMTLGNGDDELYISYDDGISITVFDGIVWDDGDSYPDGTGASMSLDPSALDADDNDDGSLWCLTSKKSIYGDGDYGTPGAVNEECR
jgi:hypothetical protein